MKIKVINLKNFSSYLLKIGILLIIAIILGKFFYNNRGVDASLKVDSSKLYGILNKEIILFNDTEKSNDNLDNYIYSKNTLNKEIGLIQLVANQNIANINNNIYGKSDSENMDLQENQNNLYNTNSNETVTDNNANAKETIQTAVEPEVRSEN